MGLRAALADRSGMDRLLLLEVEAAVAVKVAVGSREAGNRDWDRDNNRFSSSFSCSFLTRISAFSLPSLAAFQTGRGKERTKDRNAC